MTDETRDQRLEETEEQDVEAHHRLKGAMDEGSEEFRNETDDDVEGHAHLKSGPLGEPSLD